MTMIAFMSSDDRKTLAVVAEALAYAARELGELHVAQPELQSAVETALSIATSLPEAQTNSASASGRTATKN